MKPGSWVSFWRSVVRFQAAKLNPRLALRNTVGVILPLAAGLALGAVPLGLVACLGALNVCFSDGQEPYNQRARRMLAASGLVAAAVFAGALSGANIFVAIAVTAGWALGAGMLVALSSTAADLGAMSVVTLVVFAALPRSLYPAASAAVLAFAGGLLQMLLSLAFWPLRPYVPERRALGELFLELSRTAVAGAPATEAPAGSAQSSQAQLSLATLGRDRSLQRERLRLLLSQAERIRLGLLALGRLRARIARDTPGSCELGILERYRETCRRLLASVGRLLSTGEPAALPGDLEELRRLAEELCGPQAAVSPATTVMMADSRRQMDSLAGQLRAVMELSLNATPAGMTAFERREAARPWRLRIRGTLATLRANLTLESAACRHAIRLAICVAAGTALAHGLHLQRSYWLPMTVAIVLKPDFTATFSRGVLRLAGTFVGLGLATALFHLLPPGPWLQLALIAVLTFMLRCFGPANYGILTTAVTALVVVLLAITGVEPKAVIAARGLNTAAGGLIALLAYAAWPTWERTLIPQAWAQMLDAYRDYFHAVRDCYENRNTTCAGEIDRTRLQGRLARSNLEASLERFSAEPGVSPSDIRSLSGMTASSHRLVQAMMSLETGLATSPPAPPRETFRKFADDVERTLRDLSAALRGAAILRENLPDLREDHNALAQSGDPPTERYALVTVEADRITNSLNTLAEELLRWNATAPVNAPWYAKTRYADRNSS